MRRVVNLIIFSFLLLIPFSLYAQDEGANAVEGESTDSSVSADSSESVSEGEADSAPVAEPAADSEEGYERVTEGESRLKATGDKKKKRDFQDKIVVIQRKPFMRRGRVEIAPLFIGGINDSLLTQVGVGLTLNYYILDWLSIGVSGSWQDWRFASNSMNSLSSTYDTLVDATDAIPTTSIVDSYVGGVVGFAPIYGKFSLFNTTVIHWDLSLGIGGGLVSSRANKFLGGGIITVENRWFLLKWLSFNIELRGLIYYEDIGSKKGVFTHWQAGVGVGFWLPPSWTYKTDW